MVPTLSAQVSPSLLSTWVQEENLTVTVIQTRDLRKKRLVQAGWTINVSSRDNWGCLRSFLPTVSFPKKERLSRVSWDTLSIEWHSRRISLCNIWEQD